MGSGVLNGSGWPLNRDRMAELLGFDSPRCQRIRCRTDCRKHAAFGIVSMHRFIDGTRQLFPSGFFRSIQSKLRRGYCFA